MSRDKLVDIKKSSLSLVFRLFGLGVGYLITIIISNAKGAEALGLFSWAWSFSQIFAAVSKMGLDYYMIPTVAWLYQGGKNTRGDQYFLEILIHILIFSSAILIFFIVVKDIFLSNFAILNDDSSVLYAIFLCAMSLSIFQSIIEFLKAKGDVLTASFFQNLTILLILIICIFVLYVFGVLQEISVAHLLMLSFISATCLILFAALKQIGRGTLRIQIPRIKIKRFIKGFPFMLQAFWVLALTWIDVILMGFWASPEEVGVYSAVSRLASLSTIVLFTLNGIVLKDMAVALKSANRNNLTHLITRITFFNQGLSLLGISMLWVVSGYALLLFGEEFVTGEIALKILLIGYLINLAFGPTDLVLQLGGKPVRVVYAAALGVIANIFLASYLIPLYGVVGASISTAVSLVIFRVITIYYCWFELGVITLNYNVSNLSTR